MALFLIKEEILDTATGSEMEQAQYKCYLLYFATDQS